MSKTKKIVLTGPESVGKSTLTLQLGKYFNVPFGKELARDYIEKLNCNYTKNDVLDIASLQIEQEQKLMKSNAKFVVFDTDLIITKIWLLHVYGDCPSWINKYLEGNLADLHLLCYYDIVWKYDPVRENANIRPKLFDLYKNEIEKLSIPYAVVNGIGDERFVKAKNAINEIL